MWIGIQAMQKFINYKLHGIHCGSCVAKITKELNHRFSLNEVSVDKESEMLHFTGQS